MITIQKACLLVLTYKRKILLKRREELITPVNKNSWSFVENINGDEKAVLKEVEKEMNITIDHATFLSTYFDNVIKRHFYHAELTDANVNQIKRHDGEELQFFSLKEVEKLILSASSKLLFTQHKNIIESSFKN